MPPIFRAVALRAAGAVLFALAVAGSAHAADLRANEVRAVLANAERDKGVTPFNYYFFVAENLVLANQVTDGKKGWDSVKCCMIVGKPPDIAME